MTTRILLRSALGIALAAGTTIVLADEPGPGGTKVPKPVTGEQVYRAVCQACHMADGRGATGAAKIPALAANPGLEAPEYPISLIAMGRGAMPPLTDTLTPAQVAMVVTYIRTHFGNHYAKPVTAEEATRIIADTHVVTHPEE